MDYIILCQDELPYFLLLLKSLSSKRDTIHFIVNSQALYERIRDQGVSAEVSDFITNREKYSQLATRHLFSKSSSKTSTNY